MIDYDAIRARLGQADCVSYFPRGQEHGGDVEPFAPRHVRQLAAHGIHSVEIGGYPASFYDYADEARLRPLDAAYARYGVSPVSAHCPDLLRYPIEDAAAREDALRKTEDAVRSAWRHGARLMVVHAIPHTDNVDVIRTLLDRTKDLDMRFTNENLPFDRLEDVAAFVDAVGRENYGTTLDIGHVVVKRSASGPATFANGRNLLCEAGGARKAIATLGGRLWHLHLHDFVECDHYAPFYGGIRWRGLFEALFDSGYAGAFMFECEYPNSEAIYKNVGAFPELLRKLAEDGE